MKPLSCHSQFVTRKLASFPGLPTIQFLIACSMQKKLQVIKNWTVGMPGNKATRIHGQDNFHEKVLVHINVQEKLVVLKQLGVEPELVHCHTTLKLDAFMS